MSVEAVRSGFTFWRSYVDAARALPKKQRLQLYEAIIDYGLDGTEPEDGLDTLPAAMFALMKPGLDKGHARSAAGRKTESNANQTEIKTESNANQTEIKTESNANQTEIKTESNAEPSEMITDTVIINNNNNNNNNNNIQSFEVKEVKDKNIEETSIDVGMGGVGGKGKTWQTDFDVYIADATEAYNAIRADTEFVAKLAARYPAWDIHKSLEASFENYWGTTDGWDNKRKKKHHAINWKQTYARTLELNKVYRPREEVEATRKAEERRRIIAKYEDPNYDGGDE